MRDRQRNVGKNVTFEAGKVPSGMSVPELAKLVGLSRMQVYRLALAGNIPGAKRKTAKAWATRPARQGGHFYFVRCPALQKWIAERRAPGGPKRKLPPWMEADYRLLKLWKLVRDNPLAGWPAGYREKFLEDLARLSGDNHRPKVHPRGHGFPVLVR